MKALLNWRYYVMVLLAAIGTIAFMYPFGDTAEPIGIGKWLVILILSQSIAFPVFALLGKLTRKWERENKIPEFSDK